MKTVRQVGNWTLLSKSIGDRIVYWIDSGNDDVSEYMDEFDCIDLIECKEFEFVNKCLGFFN